MKYSQDIQKLKGIGDKTAKLFYKLGIHNTEDLLMYYPRDYQTFDPPIKLSRGRENEVATFQLTISENFKWKKVRNLSIGTGFAGDGQDKAALTFFNTPYLKSKLAHGNTYLFRGKLKIEKGKYQLDQPKIYTWAEYE